MDTSKKYLTEKLNPILEPLVAECLQECPKDPAAFILEWIKKKYPRLAKPIPKLEKKEEAGSEDESSEEDEEDISEIPAMSQRSSVARKAISAEAYGTWNKKEDFKPIIIQKTEDQKIRIREKLRGSFIFNALDSKELEMIVDACSEKHFKKGDVIIKQDDEGDNLYVVETGTLDCHRRMAKGEEPKFLRKYEAGEAFGELALLYNAPRAATITALDDCTLWALDRVTFSNLVKEATRKKRSKYEEFLKSVKILSTIESYEMMKIMDTVKPVEFKAGENIITEGEEGNIFFLLASGEAYATKIVETGKPPEKVMDYTKGSYFGELALLRNTPRAASVIAKTDCLCLTLDRHSFKRLLGPLDDLLKRNTDIYKQFH